MDEDTLRLFHALHDGLPREAPGDDASSLAALALVGALPPAPRIADMGCGPGAASLLLAARTGGHVTAIDLHAPYLHRLGEAARRRGLRDRILPVQADMAAPPLPPGSLDLVWSEGAVYHLGFAEGLRRWRGLVRDRGAIAVSDATWLTDDPPAAAGAFWAEAYPAMTTIAANRAAMARSGWRPLGHLVLPAAAWDAYYGPLEARLQVMRRDHAESPALGVVLAATEAEIDLYRRAGNSFGYVFYVGTAA